MKLEYKIIIGFFCLTVLLGGFLYLQQRAISSLKEENKLWQENFNQTLNERDKEIVLQTVKEFKKAYPHLDSIATANNITNIRHIHNTTYTNDMDTLKIPIFVEDSTKPDYFKFEVDTNCFTINGIVDVPNKEIVFTTLKVEDEITTFYYWERRRLFGWSWTPKWGRKSNHAKTISECSDKTTTIDITIEKNNK